MHGAPLREDLVLLLVIGAQLAVTGVLVATGALVARRAGARRPLDIATAGLLVPAAAGWTSFLAYAVHPAVGRVVSVGILLGSLTLCAVLVRRSLPAALDVRRALARPAGLAAAAVVLVTATGFLHGGTQAPVSAPAVRYTHQLPSDNVIPLLFADPLWQGDPVPDPLVADYQASDRPPLQTGMFLTVRPFLLAATTLNYQVLGGVAQLLFIVALWAFLEEMRVAPQAAALAVAAVTCSGLTFLHGFFVWPKLLPVTYLLLACAYLLSDARDTRRSVPVAIALGLCAAAAVLGHGGSAFALAGIAVALLLLRRLPSARFVAIAMLSAAVVVAPWAWFRVVVQPPGNRLEKWHLAGVMERDDRSTVAALTTAYAELDAADIVAHKAANVGSLVGPVAVYREALSHVPDDLPLALQRLRSIQLMFLVPAIGVLVVGPLALLDARRRRRGRDVERTVAARVWLCVVCGLTVWVLAMFGPGTAVAFQGSLLFVVLSAAASVLALWAWSPRAAVAFVAVSVAAALALYVVAPPGTEFARAIPAGGGVHPLLALTAAGSLAVIGALLWGMAHASPTTA